MLLLILITQPKNIDVNNLFHPTHPKFTGFDERGIWSPSKCIDSIFNSSIDMEVWMDMFISKILISNDVMFYSITHTIDKM